MPGIVAGGTQESRLYTQHPGPVYGGLFGPNQEIGTFLVGLSVGSDHEHMPMAHPIELIDSTSAHGMKIHVNGKQFGRIPGISNGDIGHQGGMCLGYPRILHGHIQEEDAIDHATV